MLRKVRIVLASVFFICITLLLMGYSDIFGGVVDFMPKLQFLPAVLAVNLGFVALVLILTLILGRVYCSVICPLGVFQDLISWVSSKRKGKKLRFGFTKEKKIIRYGVFSLFLISLFAGFQLLVILIAPYSLYSRFVQSLFNHFGTYMTIIAIATIVLISVLAFLYGRTWCNTICPVGTALSFFSRFSLFRPIIDVDKCKNCKLCEKKCKSNCIDISNHKIDYSRCVTCFDCIDNCKFGAMHYRNAYKPYKPNSCEPQKPKPKNEKGRRAFLISIVMGVAASAIWKVKSKVNDVAELTGEENKKKIKKLMPKEEPKRANLITPPGALSADNFYSKCTACQLCVASCPSKIIKPTLDFDHFMQPHLTYLDNFCQLDCNRCSQVCPAGAILPYELENKKNIHVGLAKVDYEDCLRCSLCAKSCPVGAISMVAPDPSDSNKRKIPLVDSSKCIGCGACEFACPVNPISAIHVDGRLVQND